MLVAIFIPEYDLGFKYILQNFGGKTQQNVDFGGVRCTTKAINGLLMNLS